MQVRVAAARRLTPTIRELELAPLASPLPVFSAGSHVIVHVPGETVRKNAYSLVSSPWATDTYRLAVRHDPAGRGGSRWIHEHLNEGDVLTIEPPRNFFAPVRTARHHVLVAGGIGVTPFVSYVHQLSRDGASFELHYAVRAAGELPFLDELKRRCAERLHVYVDPDGSALMRGLRDRILGRQPVGTDLSLCGPEPMMEAVVGAATELGWPSERIHLERFSLPAGERKAFTAVDHGTGTHVRVSAEATLLEALEDAGFSVPYLCRQGICGQCLTRVREGSPDHHDHYLTPEERAAGAMIMPCVSRSLSTQLVLDLPRSDRS
jgi:ferredoxin-NADP reductase